MDKHRAMLNVCLPHIIGALMFAALFVIWFLWVVRMLGWRTALVIVGLIIALFGVIWIAISLLTMPC